MVQSRPSLIPQSSYPIDEPFSLNAEYLNDADPSKVNLGIGAYRTDEGRPWPLPVVIEAEKTLARAKDVSRHEYLTIQGDLRFLAAARDVAFDFKSASAEDELGRSRIASIQTVSGTGANHIGARYLSDVLRPRQVWLPDPTWANHTTIWELVKVPVRTYPYYDAANRCVDFPGMMQALGCEAERGDVVLFHACAHNPTGSDPSKDEWTMLAKLCQRRGLIPFFDLAYQGFASGDTSQDAWALKHFFTQTPDLEFCVAQSFSKNFGLYGQRAGALHIVVGEGSVGHRDAIVSNLCHLVRGEYSMAPRTGSDIVRTTLESPSLRKRWERDLITMSDRIKSMRNALYAELVRLGTPGEWDHIITQIGMFSYTGLSERQVLQLRKEYHIFMLLSGRISMSGLTTDNVSYVARAFDDVVRKVP